ncbi:MAG: GFA family protein [Pseudomonadota bacterium]
MIGKCACQEVTFNVEESFLYVHCCHCTWCQRETGSGFAINGLIETAHISVLQGEPVYIDIPSGSGEGQQLVQCGKCGTTLWSHYAAARDAVAFVRVGTLDDAASIEPDIHIFTSTKLPWVVIPDGANQVDEYYRRSANWPTESVTRYKTALEAANIK